jgi:hypothetical protein
MTNAKVQRPKGRAKPKGQTRNFDGLVKSPITSFLVIPAKAGIQIPRALTECLDPGFHRGDDFLQTHQILSLENLDLIGHWDFVI